MMQEAPDMGSRAQASLSATTIAQIEAGLGEGLLPLWIYNDAEIHSQELDKVFGGSWIFLAHETEIPQPGDYVARSIGEDPFIVVRGDDGQIRAFFDSCRHRGARVCQADKGRATAFKCPYHGWTYDRSGALDGVPNKKTAYKGLDVAQWGLMPIPRMESYRGLIFGSLDPAIHTLDAHLGDYKWYLDLHLALPEGGLEVVGEPHRWYIDADWKSGADNFSGDSYHTQSLHQSILRLGLSSREAAGASGGKNDIHVTECDGHSTSIRRKDPGQTYFWGHPAEVYRLFTDKQLTPEQFDLARRSVSHTGTIFPNLSLIHIWATDAPGNPGAAYFSLRQWKPRGPGKMEAWSWVLVPKGASTEYKARAYKVAVASFSPSGNFEQDDGVTWGGVARAAKGRFAKRSGMALNYQMGMPGISDANVIADWPGPGVVYDTNLEEGVQRTFFLHWCKAMLRP